MNGQSESWTEKMAKVAGRVLSFLAAAREEIEINTVTPRSAPFFSGAVSGPGINEFTAAEGASLEAVNPEDPVPHYRINMFMTEDLGLPEDQNRYRFYLRLQRSESRNGIPAPGGINYFPVNETTLPSCRDQLMDAWNESAVHACHAVKKYVDFVPSGKWTRAPQ